MLLQIIRLLIINLIIQMRVDEKLLQNDYVITQVITKTNSENNLKSTVVLLTTSDTFLSKI